MSNDARLELLKAHHDAQEKYVYFILAAAGAAIAFAITQTQTATLSFSKIPLEIAIACWGGSFISGCQHIWQVINLTQTNYQLLRMRDGLHPKFPADPNLIAYAEKDLEERSEKSGRYYIWQFRLLIAGAAFYIVWHITEMFLRTPPISH